MKRIVIIFLSLVCFVSEARAEAYDTDVSLRVPQLVHSEWEEYPTNWLDIDKISIAEAQTMTDVDFRTNTVFYCYPPSMNQPTISLLVRGAHLAQGIPALTPAAGRLKFGDANLRNQSFDCNASPQIVRPNGWPERSNYQGQWCHSDLKDVAYFYVFEFYKKKSPIANLGVARVPKRMVEVGQLEPSVQKIGETLFCDGPTYSFFGLTHLRFPLFSKCRLGCFAHCFQGFMLLSRRWDFG